MSITPFLIAIGGPSCSGKSTLARELRSTIGETTSSLIAIDDYYRDLTHLGADERAAANFDAPDAIEHELLTSHLQQLAQGETVECPQYDFASHSRTSERRRIQPSGVIIVEGLFALHWEAIRQLVHLRIYVDSRDSYCLTRRLARDVNDRGRTTEAVMDQYSLTVRPMRRQYIEPTKKHADIVVQGVKPVTESASLIMSHVEEIVHQ